MPALTSVKNLGGNFQKQDQLMLTGCIDLLGFIVDLPLLEYIRFDDTTFTNVQTLVLNSAFIFFL